MIGKAGAKAKRLARAGEVDGRCGQGLVGEGARSQCGCRSREAEEALPHPRVTREEAEAAVRTLIRWAGDDPAREGLIDTPRRVAEAYLELFKRLSRGPPTR